MVSKQKILIVDDDNNIAELISLYLVKECFDTKIVNDGESALEAVDSFAPILNLLIFCNHSFVSSEYGEKAGVWR